MGCTVPRRALVLVVLLSFAAAAPACGGAQGGAGPTGAGQGLVLISFLQDAFDNLALNQILEFRFSEEIDPDTINGSSLQIREGPSFGRAVPGTFRVQGAVLRWEPKLPGRCDLSDGALKADTSYRVQAIGRPEQFAIRNTKGQPLERTTTYEFRTRAETDPARFLDDDPSAGPRVTDATPADGDEAADVAAGNAVRFSISESLDPCTVDDTTVLVHIYEFGDPAAFVRAPNGLESGFAVGADTSDQLPGDPFRWGADNTTTLADPQKILTDIRLVQDFESTEIVITPTSDRFPENALIAVRLTLGIRDFAGNSLVPVTIAFTTENIPIQKGTYVLEAEGETPFDDTRTTADVDTARSPGLVQAYLLFAGDADNGPDPLRPTLPQSDAGTCANDYQVNDAIQDDFDPLGDVLLDTGSTPNPCPNVTDGSFGVVWEFRTLRIRDGITVRLIGVNPAIILVQGDILIESGARLLARGDGQGGSPRGAGEGNKNATTNARTVGGTGVAGGGDGGSSHANSATSRRVGLDGVVGYFHTTPNGPVDPNVGATGVGGSGRGNTSARWNTQANPNNRNTPSGGGGGHATAGGDGTALGMGSSPTSIDDPTEGEGGSTYGDSKGELRTPEAGSGGGAGGELRPFTSNAGRGPGGAGGAGGGFVDLTCAGDIAIFGTVDAAGSIGGTNPGGNFNPNYAWNPGTGGGGGGSGGGIRLLTPNDIIFGTTTVVTAAGGPGGPGGASQGTNPPSNAGGNGGVGRLAMEDGNSVITNLGGATVIPSEGGEGFYRSVFDATRFQGGGLSPRAVTEIFAAGPLDPMYADPIQDYTGQQDFAAAILTSASVGTGKTGILLEVRGYQMLPNALPDLTGVIAPPTGWYTVGHLTDSGLETLPTWNLGQPSAAQLPDGPPPDNVGAGIANIDGYEYLQIRITFYLSKNIGATDPGHYLDRWVLCFTSDQ